MKLALQKSQNVELRSQLEGLFLKSLSDHLLGTGGLPN